jgi:hypothetical protein
MIDILTFIRFTKFINGKEFKDKLNDICSIEKSQKIYFFFIVIF